MAHQWFGDLVTMKWWDDIWLNEGFATWMENKPLAGVDARLEHRGRRSQRQPGGAEPRRAEDDAARFMPPVETPAQINEAFDAITYEKGAAVLRMVESYLGAETFRQGVNTYLQAHAYGNATSEDFWTTMAEASGKPVDRILPSFINQPGAPLLEVSLQCVNDRAQLDISEQRFFLDPSAAPPRPAQRWQIPVCVKTAGGSGGCDLIADNKQTLSLGNSCVPWVLRMPARRVLPDGVQRRSMLRALTPQFRKC